jgi:hypothetical protein
MKQFVKLYAEYLGGSRSPALAARIDSVNGELISRLWPIENWIAMAIGLNKFVLPPWYHERDLTEWMKEGMGISRLPTVALALMPVANRAEAMDPVQTLVRNAQIQRACIELSREMPETGATRLGEYGVAILTSTQRGKSPSRARVELRERAEKFQAFLRDRFGVRALVGIGQFVQAGSPLHPSLRSAVQALHMCVQTEKDLLFCDDFRQAASLRRPAGRRDGPDRRGRSREPGRDAAGERSLRAPGPRLCRRADRVRPQPVPRDPVSTLQPHRAALPDAHRRP